MEDFYSLLDKSASRHSHLCPRQVLGVRMGIAGGDYLGLSVPRRDKKLLVILETDGCFADGIEVSTSCTVGHRTMRFEDYGKVAATFVEAASERAVRIAPRRDVRQRARLYAPDETRHYFAQLYGYQRMPIDELFSFQEVKLVVPVTALISRPGIRVECEACGEEIINERQVVHDGRILCRGCAEFAYYRYFLQDELLQINREYRSW